MSTEWCFARERKLRRMSEKMLKPLLVGQAPGESGDGIPLSGRCGRKLCGLMKTDLDDYLEKFDRVNVLDFFPGKNGKGDAFPINKAREMASRIRLGERPFVVLLGRNVARAFGMAKMDPLTWTTVRGTPVALVPHPSGVNRWWNDCTNVRRARRFLRNIYNVARVNCELSSSSKAC